MACSPWDGRVKPQRFQPLPVRSQVLKRVIDRKPLDRCRRQKRIICRHEHRSRQLLTREGLADSEGTRQVQRIIGPQRMPVQQRAGLRDDWRRDGGQRIRLRHVLQNLLREILRLVGL
jgi:hypothetical protein